MQSRLDLPGTHMGLDVYYRRQPPMDVRTYQNRLNEWGPAVRQGQDVLVTAVRVKGKNIEFQLGGGGLNETASVNFSTYVPKSRFEEDLERDIKNESDPRRRDAMRRDLDRERSRRESEERRLRAEKARLEEMKRRELRDKAMRFGSRINVWFEKDYLRETVPTPDELMRMLDEWIDFSPMMRGGGGGGFRPQVSQQQQVQPLPPQQQQQAMQGRRGVSATPLRRGMDSNEVRRILGNPDRFRDGREGSLQMRSEAWELDSETVEVDFVEGLVVRWRVNSK